MARQIIVDILGNASHFNNTTKQATTTATKFSNVLAGIGTGIGLSGFMAVSSAAQMVTDFIGDSIKAASDLSETMNKSGVVFGNSADTISDFGDTAAESMGMSKRAAVEAAATFGNFFVGLKLGKPQAANMSKAMVTLAGDLASFNNLDPTVTLDKLRAGLAGESEPLRQLGVFLTEAKVKAKAMELGLLDAHGELTEGAKVQARYALILEETTTAQGDFARTADDLANRQRTANATLEDSQAVLGEKMLPAQLAVTNAQIDFFTGLTAVTDFIQGKATPESMAYAHTLGLLSEEELRVKVAAMAAAEELKTVDESTRAAKRAAIDARPAIRDLGTTAEVSGESFEEMAEKARTAARKFITDVFDPLNTRADLYQDRLDQNALEEQFRNAKTRQDSKLTAAEIVKNIGRQADKLMDLSDQGRLTSRDVDRYEANVRASFDAMGKKVPPDIQRVIDKLRALDKFDGKTLNYRVNLNEYVTQTTKKAEARAHGGWASGMTLVGERGPELVNLPSGSYVNTNEKSANILLQGARGGGGGGTTVIVQGNIYGVDDLMSIMAMRLRLDGA